MKQARSTNRKPLLSGAERSRTDAKWSLPAVKRIVIVDDHPLFRKGLEQLINSSGNLTVCGEAGRASQAMDVIRQITPDLAIVDLSLPGANGIELIKNIRAEFAKLPILVLSMHDESLYALRALRAGAQGYVMKQEALDNVLHAVRELLKGRPYLSQEMSVRLIRDYSQQAAGEVKASPTDKLSDRELEVLELIGRGREVREIAKALHLSPKTVETHRAHIKEKLNLTNARQVARFAVQWVTQNSAG